MKTARKLAIVLLAAAASTGGGSLAAASGPPDTFTETTQGLVETFVDVFPTCDDGGQKLLITTVSNVVEHGTVFDDGSGHFTFTQTGTFVATAKNDPTLQVASGRFTISGSFNDTGQTVNGTFTFSVRGTTADGERINFHSTEHFNVRPDGTVNEFFHCHD